MRVRAVLFDYFGTLTPTVLAMTTEWEQHAIGQALGVPPDELERAWRASFRERSTGRTGDLRATLRMLARQLGAEPDEAGLTEATRVRMAAYVRSARPRPEAVQVLTTLRAKGLRLAVISDCSDELVRLWPGLPIAAQVDTVVFSATIGRRKPDPLLYRTACERLDVPAAGCLYIGDGGSGELTGARSMGMSAALLADADWAIGHRYDQDTWDGPVIHRLAEVHQLLA